MTEETKKETIKKANLPARRTAATRVLDDGTETLSETDLNFGKKKKTPGVLSVVVEHLLSRVRSGSREWREARRPRETDRCGLRSGSLGAVCHRFSEMREKCLFLP